MQIAGLSQCFIRKKTDKIRNEKSWFCFNILNINKLQTLLKFCVFATDFAIVVFMRVMRGTL